MAARRDGDVGGHLTQRSRRAVHVADDSPTANHQGAVGGVEQLDVFIARSARPVGTVFGDHHATRCGREVPGVSLARLEVAVAIADAADVDGSRSRRGRANGGTRRRGEGDGEGLVAFGEGVGCDIDRQVRRKRGGGELEDLVGRGGVIRAREGRTVGRGVGDRHAPARQVAEREREVQDGCARVAFDHRSGADGNGRGVVVEDGAKSDHIVAQDGDLGTGWFVVLNHGQGGLLGGSRA